MQAGREMDAKVAEALGLTGYMPCNADDCKACDQRFVRFSTTWEGMGVLVEEARKKGLHIDIQTHESHYAAHVFDSKEITRLISSASANQAPYAACLALIKAVERVA
jgi:hypothetical protein